MYEIKITDEFSGAHRLRNYRGKCESLHGHNWRVEISAYSAKLNSQGMVMDFKDLKASLRKALEILDHKHLNDLPYFKKKNPTSENIAEFIHKKLKCKIRYKLKVCVWETDRSQACYHERG